MRRYLEKDVYEAAQERLHFIFKKFPRIYLSFSGGKDSGVMLNLVVDFMRKHGIKEKIGLMTMDNECNYEHSLRFMRSIIEKNIDLLDVYWCCLPLTLPCTVSSYRVDWQCWKPNEQHLWVRPMPKEPYVVNVDNHSFPFFQEDMLDKEFYDNFGEWYSQGERTACLIGIRTDESLNRYRAIMNKDKAMVEGQIWTKKNSDNVYNCYPIYDWRTDDIWTANAKFEWDYNQLYDIFYMSGMPVGKMRVACPFMSESKSSLGLYRVIDPPVWSRLCARVQGANFIATYGKQLDYKSIKLPEGHTWKSFVKFLLATLPKETSANFKSRFTQSLRFWARVGRGLPEEIIEDLKANGIEFYFNGITPHGGNGLRRVRIVHPPDQVDCLKTNHSMVTSWKRFALTILKNDHTCKYLGLAPTKQQALRQKEIQRKYSRVLKPKGAEK